MFALWRGTNTTGHCHGHADPKWLRARLALTQDYFCFSRGGYRRGWYLQGRSRARNRSFFCRPLSLPLSPTPTLLRAGMWIRVLAYQGVTFAQVSNDWPVGERMLSALGRNSHQIGCIRHKLNFSLSLAKHVAHEYICGYLRRRAIDLPPSHQVPGHLHVAACS